MPAGSSWDPVDVAWRLVVVGIGAGLTNGPVVTLAMGLAPPDLMATVGASTSLSRNLGFAVGPALAIGAWAAGGYELAGMRAGLVVATGVVIVGGIALLGRSRVPARHDHELDETSA